jgi:hypothetical protein
MHKIDANKVLLSNDQHIIKKMILIIIYLYFNIIVLIIKKHGTIMWKTEWG